MDKNSFLILTFIFSTFLSGCIFGSRYDRYVNENIKPLTINGIVMNKYREHTGCFGAIIIKQDDSIDTLHNIFFCTIKNEKIWSYVLPNDSLYKKEGSLEAEVVRNGTRIKFTFPTHD